MATIALSQDDLVELFRLDEEVIDIETTENGNVYPVVKAYDDETYHLKFWCIHCRNWHIHGRGGPSYPYQEGRSGMAGHRSAHCTVANSPFKYNGVILDVVGKFSEAIRRQHRKGAALYCPSCMNNYSAAFNACDCVGSFINKARKSSHPRLAERYQLMILNKK